jgi:hypothetical protein
MYSLRKQLSVFLQGYALNPEPPACQQHTCNYFFMFFYSGGGDWEDRSLRQVCQKVPKVPSQPIKTECSGKCLPSQLFGKYKQEDSNPGQSEHKARPYLQNTQNKKDWGYGSSGKTTSLQA